MQQIVIDRRFQGPSQSANGGYIAGLLAELIDGPAEITLRAPPPLDTPLDLSETETGFELSHEGNPIGSVRSGSFSLDIPPKPSDAAITEAEPNYPGRISAVLPHCFVCGVERKPGDALRVFAAPVDEGHKMVAAHWHPHKALAGDDGYLLERYVFAALDCPGAYAFWGETSASMLLGRITGEVTGRVKAGDACTVMAWQEGSEGRKAYAGSAVLGPDGTPVASAYATWIRVDSLS